MQNNATTDLLEECCGLSQQTNEAMFREELAGTYPFFLLFEEGGTEGGRGGREGGREGERERRKK